MNSKYKNIFLAIIIILIIIIILTIILLTNLKDEENIMITTQGDKGQEVDYSVSEIKTVTEKIEYYTVSNIINNYVKALNKNNSIYYVGNEIDKTIQQKYIYNLLSKEYIEKNNITKDNVMEKIPNYNVELMYIPLKLKVLEKENINKYIAYGILENMDNEYIEEIYIVINLDKKNKTYSIDPIEQNYNDIDEISIDNNNNLIEKNTDNSYQNQNITNEYIVNQYLSLYKRLSLAKPEMAYNLLNEEYRNKRFESLENFKQYINENKDELYSLRIEKYLVNNYEDYIEYVAENQFGNTYIFYEYKDNKFEIKLDEYTLITDKFKTIYANAKDQIKVQMNIDKFFKMVNNYDYLHAYNCLSEGFKNNYFKTEESFKEYLKNNIFKNNKIEYGTVKKEGSNVYSCELKLINIENSSDEKKMNIVVKIKDNYDFEMSFSM